MPKYQITVHYGTGSFLLDTEDEDVKEIFSAAEVDLNDRVAIADFLNDNSVEDLFDAYGAAPDMVERIELIEQK